MQRWGPERAAEKPLNLQVSTDYTDIHSLLLRIVGLLKLASSCLWDTESEKEPIILSPCLVADKTFRKEEEEEEGGEEEGEEEEEEEEEKERKRRRGRKRRKLWLVFRCHP
ncbi:histone-lysine N-methyltransferase EHMT2-like [Cavia porcellus]|uniref:histone-lysine N-methyltransferase EHMT2-like n=1 Tax=Cavia porcellus TaxID=10141 RepID=UPI002FE24312